ncbi:Gfo/Idh/MocA family protein [Haladaptatus sp. DFWS20]|uniref:Gfo/Idh/MocA family protein n=1 Tax=Haladaptatus sp. DFWS20 TaxID=3403467 RepID=UPI003EBA22DA
MTTRIGYVGLNHHHRDPYLASIDQLDAEVTAVADATHTPATLGVDSLSGCPVYDNAAELLEATDVDLLWLTLPNRETPAVINTALDYGIDVFTEKPVARNAAELEPIARRARESPATVGVSYTWRGHPIARELRERQREGFFGSIRGFVLRFIASNLDTRDTDHYLFDRVASRGGIVQWLGVHWLDLLPWILDDPIVRVNAQIDHGTNEVDVEDGATLQLETASGAVGTHTCGYFLREGRYDTRVNVYGESGRSRWDPIGATFGFDDETTLDLDSSDASWASTSHRRITHEYQSAPGYGGHWGLKFFDQFLDACAGDAPNPATLDDALDVLRVLDAIYQSADDDEWVEIDRSD